MWIFVFQFGIIDISCICKRVFVRIYDFWRIVFGFGVIPSINLFLLCRIRFGISIGKSSVIIFLRMKSITPRLGCCGEDDLPSPRVCARMLPRSIVCRQSRPREIHFLYVTSGASCQLVSEPCTDHTLEIHSRSGSVSVHFSATALRLC